MGVIGRQDAGKGDLPRSAVSPIPLESGEREPPPTSRRASRTIGHYLATAAQMVGDAIVALIVVLILISVRLDLLQGTWSASVSPLQLAAGFALSWVAAISLTGAYRERVHLALLSFTTRVLAADLLLIGATLMVWMVLDLANVSRLLLVMVFVALPIVIVGTRLAPRLLRVNPEARTISAKRTTTIDEPSRTVTVIEPPKAWPGLALNELWRFRSICFVLVRRNLKVRYRQTIVGAAWAILQPTLLMALFTVFFGVLGRMPAGDIPYPVFFLLGLLPFQMVSKILSEGSSSVVANSALVTRVYFPRAYFPLSVAIASVVDFALASTVLAVLMIVLHIVPSPMIVLTPLFVAIAWSAALGVAFWLSALNVSYRDITQLLPFLAQLWMFSSPIMYPVAIVPEKFQAIYFLNPVAVVVTGFRWAVAGAPPPPTEAWVLGIVTSLILLMTGYVFFRRREATFADTI